MELETQHLTLRPWRVDDIDNYRMLAADVGYNCFSPPGYFPLKTDREIADRIQAHIELYETKRLGKFLVFEKSSGSVVGSCGLAPYPALGENAVELGYRLRLPFWEKGYATESAARAVDHGLETLKITPIYAFAVRQNRASIAVLRKLKFRAEGQIEHYGLPHELFVKP